TLDYFRYRTLFFSHGTSDDDLRRVQRHRGTTAAANPDHSPHGGAAGHRDRGGGGARDVADLQAPAGTAGGGSGARARGGAAAALRARREGAARGARVGRRLRALLERELR